MTRTVWIPLIAFVCSACADGLDWGAPTVISSPEPTFESYDRPTPSGTPPTQDSTRSESAEEDLAVTGEEPAHGPTPELAVQEGDVPYPNSVTASSLVGSHGSTSVDPDCADVLCLKAGVAYAPELLSGEYRYWLQSKAMMAPVDGMRPGMDVEIVIDRSASMSIDMRETNLAAIALIESMLPVDRAGVFAYNHEVDQLASISMTETAGTLPEQIGAIDADGGASAMRAALDGALDDLRHYSGPHRIRRVVIFSCSYPSISPATWFQQTVREAAEEGIHVTFIGVLTGPGAAVQTMMLSTPGGRFRTSSLQDLEGFAGLAHWLMPAQLAFDLTLAYDPSVDLEIDAAITPQRQQPGAFRRLTQSEVVPESRPPWFLLRLVPGTDGTFPAGWLSLSFERPLWEDGGRGGEDEFIAQIQANGEAVFQTSSVRQDVALANAGEAAHQGLRAYHNGDRESALELLDLSHRHLTDEAEALGGNASLEDAADYLRGIADLVRGSEGPTRGPGADLSMPSQPEF